MNNNALEFVDAIQKTKNKEGLILIKRKLLEILEREIPNFQPPNVFFFFFFFFFLLLNIYINTINNKILIKIYKNSLFFNKILV